MDRGLVHIMRIIAIEEHFTTAMYRENVARSDYRNFYLSSRGAHLGHDIAEQLFDLGDKRLRYMDAAGVDIQVLSFGSPGPQGFGKEIAIPMARDANEHLYQAINAHPTRFAGFAALPTADPEQPAREIGGTVKEPCFDGAVIHGHKPGSFPDDKKYLPIFECTQAMDVEIYPHPTMAHPGATKA